MGDDREEIARAAWVLAVSDEPDFFGQEGAEFWERSKQITAERPEANCASLVNRCYSFADAILARQGPGPGEAVAWRWRHTAAVYGDVSTTPGPWKDGHPPKHSAAEAWKYEVQKLVAIAATPTREA